jgi:hypothetical protein
MHRPSAQPPARQPMQAPKPSLKPLTKRLDLDLLAIARRRKADAGIQPGIPFH